MIASRCRTSATGGGKIDWLGGIFVVLCIGALMLALTWGSGLDPTVLACSLLAGDGVAFILIERAQKRRSCWTLFRSGLHDIDIAFHHLMASGTIVYLPLFLAGPRHPAINSGCCCR
jgi:hypothetical protein